MSRPHHFSQARVPSLVCSLCGRHEANVDAMLVMGAGNICIGCIQELSRTVKHAESTPLLDKKRLSEKLQMNSVDQHEKSISSAKGWEQSLLAVLMLFLAGILMLQVLSH